MCIHSICLVSVEMWGFLVKLIINTFKHEISLYQWLLQAGMYLAAAKRKKKKNQLCGPGLSRWARTSRSSASIYPVPGHHRFSLWPLLCFMQYCGIYLPVTDASGIHAGKIPRLCGTENTESSPGFLWLLFLRESWGVCLLFHLLWMM